MDNSTQKLQALLYAHGGEMTKSDVSAALGFSAEQLSTVISSLTAELADQGIAVYETETTLSLRTAEKYVSFIRDLQKKNSEKDVGTAGLEVLATVLYNGGASRAMIDYIRGVNSSTTLRQLVLRGLLERTKDPYNARSWLYTATPEFLEHIGVQTPSDLPEYDILSETLRSTAIIETGDYADEN